MAIITWLPYNNPRISAHVLSSPALGAQISGSLSLFRILGRKNMRSEVQFGMCASMWRDYMPYLALHIECLLEEGILRGRGQIGPNPRTLSGLAQLDLPKTLLDEKIVVPSWMSIEKLHASHRACLLKQDTHWYRQFAWDEQPMHDLWWPGRFPAPGHSLISPTGEIGMVHKYDNQRRPVVKLKDGFVTVERVDIYTRLWRTCIVKD